MYGLKVIKLAGGGVGKEGEGGEGRRRGIKGREKILFIWRGQRVEE